MANMLMYGFPRPVRIDYREVFETSAVTEFHPLTHQDPCCLHLIYQAHLNILAVHISLRVELPEAALNHLPAHEPGGTEQRSSVAWPGLLIVSLCVESFGSTAERRGMWRLTV